MVLIINKIQTENTMKNIVRKILFLFKISESKKTRRQAKSPEINR